jgi:hypothetical protein
MKTELMNWVPSTKRWTRMHKGKAYWVSCRQLDCPATKEASRDAANLYWRTIEAKHFEESQENQHWKTRAIEAALKARANWPSPIYKMNENLVPMVQAVPEELRALVGMALFGGNEWTAIAGQTKQILPEITSVPSDETMGAQVEKWITSKEGELKTGKIKPSTYRQVPLHAKRITEWYGKDKSARKLNEATCQDFFDHLTDLSVSNASKRSHWMAFRQIVHKIYLAKLIEKPRNLDEFSFPLEAGEKINWTGEEFRAEYQKADELGKLILCLAANCGFYPSDMGNLHRDYKGGATITRQRTKTGSKSPKVCFTLWTETQDLLAAHGHKLKEMYVSEYAGNGKVNTKNDISKHLNTEKSLRFLRHTGNQQILNHDTLAHHASTFLSDKDNQSMSKTNYAGVIPMPVAVSELLHAFYFGA